MSITVLLPENLYSAPLRALLEPMLPPGSVIRRPEDGMENLENRRLLFAVALDPSGCSLAYYGMLQALRGCDILLRGSVAGVIVTGVGEFYTKDVARDMVFAANQAGCAFLGRPLVEATGSLANFRIQAKNLGTDLAGAYEAAVADTAQRLEHEVFALVVSGYSGCDTVARQVISAMNMNKSFYLPPRFALMATANDPGEAMAAPDINQRLDQFAETMRRTLVQE